MNRIGRLALLLVGLLALSACRSIGPPSLARDRSDYSAAMTESWKRQMLLNIVKMRYTDPPIFVDIGQIVAGYQVDYFAGVSGTIARGSGSDSAQLRGEARFTDRPTVTYTPLTGNRFITSIIAPIPPRALFQAIQAGWPADMILRLGCNAINGERNPDRVRSGQTLRVSSDFPRILELMRRLQLNDAVTVRIDVDDAARSVALVTLRAPDLTPDLVADADELRVLLGLDPAAHEFKLTYGAHATSNREIALHTRSLMAVMAMFASHIVVPETHIAEGRAGPAAPGLAGSAPTIRIHSGENAPEDAFVSVRYRERSFWIDDRDPLTKSAFAMSMLFFTLAEVETSTHQPVLTIPTG